MNTGKWNVLLAACAWLALPTHADDRTVRGGYLLATQTGAVAREYVGNGLNCTSCHIDAGRQPNALPWKGVWGFYTESGGQGGSLKEKINDCFVRSLNGKPLPADGKEMRALLTYIEWLSQGMPTGVQVEGRGLIPLTPPRAPDPVRGQRAYEEHCVACHGENGEGAPGFRGSPGYPPLWGDAAFGSGSSMAKLDVAAAFIKTNMPQRRPDSLSAEDAYDVAAYVLSKPRPASAGR